MDRIWYTYDKELEKFKRKYLKKSSKDKEVKIDYHKITALYLKVFLIFEPIRLTHEGLEKRKEISDIQFEYIMDHANEIFCASLIEVIFRGNGWDDDTKRPEKRLMLSDKEKRWLIILLNHYRIYPDTIDVLSLAHTVYYLEQARFRLP
ncbi:MAG: hypothetical protein LBH98_07945 [Chitinispirillales bacterium]|nr:hypothetical protein [Chitinispirillales bacterium]